MTSSGKVAGHGSVDWLLKKDVSQQPVNNTTRILGDWNQIVPYTERVNTTETTKKKPRLRKQSGLLE
jgi:hypothetical protein